MRALQPSVCSTIVVLTFGALLAASRPQDQVPATPDSTHVPRRVVSFEHANQELTLKCDVGLLAIKPYADNAVHVRFFPTMTKTTLPLWGISAAPSNPKYRVESTLSSIRLVMSQLIVSVDRKTAQLKFLDPKQNILLTSNRFQLKHTRVSGEETYSVHAEFIAPEEEAYYGLGQHQDGWLDQRGRAVRLWHDYEAGGEIVGIPFLITNRKYGFILDNPSRTTVIPGKDGLTNWDSEAGDALSFFVVYGNTADDIYRGYRFLTGITPLPPRSAFGFIQSKQGYRSQDELLQVARTFREKGYPADMLVADGDHWKVAGDLVFNEKDWPDPSGLNADLDRLGFKAMISCWPRFQRESGNFETLNTMGCLVKDRDGKAALSLGQDVRGALIDTTNAECAAWFWDAICKNYVSRGFASWCLDANEPDITSPGLTLHAGTGAGILNLYPLMQTRAVYEGHRRDLKERCFILSRSAYLGAQQYGMSLRSSDTKAQWDAFKRQIASGLNVAASGLGYWSSDIGGSSSPGADSADVESNYPELYVRWFEFGAFCPTFQAHGSRLGSEVWSFGDAIEKIVAKYLRLRYRLLPYIYSLARAVTDTGAPFLRALFMDFPLDPEVRDIKDEYMFGPALLVAPVVEKGKARREVYLPKGPVWYDYWTGKKYAGGQRIPVDAPLDVLPLFARAGSIIPHGNEIPNTRVEQSEVELYVYSGADAQFNLYQDDGTTYEYEKGNFSLAQLRWSETTQKILISGDDRKLFSRPQEKWLRIIR